MPVQTPPTRAQINTWRRYLANERAEAAVYRELARKREGAEREILLELAEAESRHERYWRDKLGDYVGMPRQPDLNTRVMGFMAKHFGSVFTLALMQTAESRSPYIDDEDASPQIAADERMHAEVVRALAARGRERISGGFRAAIFGANDGLVSNVALVLGVLGSGLGSTAILLTGISGLLAGALSMAAGEYVSVKSQSELLEASTPDAAAHTLPGQVDVDANELALVYRARGMSAEDAEDKAADTFARISMPPRPDGRDGPAAPAPATPDEHGHGGAWVAALSSFVCFSLGAFIPLIPFLFGAPAAVGAIIALVLVSVALLITGGITGLLSGKPPAARALRQLLIGLGAAGVTYVLGLLFGALLG
jgi:vacuolar iron transporter family protein